MKDETYLLIFYSVPTEKYEAYLYEKRKRNVSFIGKQMNSQSAAALHQNGPYYSMFCTIPTKLGDRYYKVTKTRCL